MVVVGFNMVEHAERGDRARDVKERGMADGREPVQRYEEVQC